MVAIVAVFDDVANVVGVVFVVDVAVGVAVVVVGVAFYFLPSSPTTVMIPSKTTPTTQLTTAPPAQQLPTPPTQVFLRENEKCYLDDLLHEALMRRVLLLQRWLRSALARRTFLRLKRASIVIQVRCMSLVAVVSGCCCWLLFLAVVVGCCCWLLLVAVTVTLTLTLVFVSCSTLFRQQISFHISVMIYTRSDEFIPFAPHVDAGFFEKHFGAEGLCPPQGGLSVHPVLVPHGCGSQELPGTHLVCPRAPAVFQVFPRFQEV